MEITLQQRAYEYIRQRLLTGGISHGRRLSERALAEEIGISRTPVREALNQLRSEGLLDHVNGLGVFIRTPDRRELKELYELREWIELGALGRAVRRATPQTLDRLRALCDQMAQSLGQVEARGDDAVTSEEESRWVMLDTTFHVMLLKASRNRRALKAVADLRVMSRIFGHRRESMSTELMRRVLHEHRAIVEAVADGNRSEARRLLSHHIRQGRNGSLAAYDQRRRQREAGQVIADLPQSLREEIRRIETGRNENAMAASES